MDELAALVRDDKVGLAQQVEVIGDAGQAHGKVAADFAHGQVAVAEQFEDAAAGGVIEGAEELGHDT
jgi:peptidyl-tRNA hydrolase